MPAVMSNMSVKSSFLLIMVGASAISLFSISWPRLNASLTYLPVDTAIKNYYATREIPTLQLPGLITQARKAIEKHDHYRYHDGLSALYYLRGTDDLSPTLERQSALEQAIAEAEISVSISPARPMTWQRIAQTHDLLRHSSDTIIAPLKMSIYAGRVEPTLLLGRLELGYKYLDGLDEETKGLLLDQTLVTWKLKPRELTSAIKNQRILRQGVAQLLSNTNEQQLHEMEASLEPAW
ncbi:MAG: hypothetical protein ACI9CB_003025 [Rhodothermales bacterium]|jgi:hypothetical protein